MSLNAHVGLTQNRPAQYRMMPWLVLGLMLVIDIVALRFIAIKWDDLERYVPYALMAVVISGLVYRARSAWRKDSKPLP